MPRPSLHLAAVGPAAPPAAVGCGIEERPAQESLALPWRPIGQDFRGIEHAVLGARGGAIPPRDSLAFVPPGTDLQPARRHAVALDTLWLGRRCRRAGGPAGRPPPGRAGHGRGHGLAPPPSFVVAAVSAVRSKAGCLPGRPGAGGLTPLVGGMSDTARCRLPESTRVARPPGKLESGRGSVVGGAFASGGRRPSMDGFPDDPRRAARAASAAGLATARALVERLDAHRTRNNPMTGTGRWRTTSAGSRHRASQRSR